MEPEEEARIRIAAAVGVGPFTTRRLLQKLGTATAIVGSDVSALADALGADGRGGGRVAESLHRAMAAVEPGAIAQRAAAAGARLLFLEDRDFPAMLRPLDDAPAYLWCRGTVPGDEDAEGHAARRAWLAIVGSRHAGPRALLAARRVAEMTGSAGAVIVSGGARGVDAAAHRGACAATGCTTVVLGTGIDIAYPPEHAALFREIVAAGGCLLSEFPPGTPARPGHFPRRNRIVAGLSHAVLVIQAREHSGALITARLATEAYGREVMVLAGPGDEPAWRGGLRLVQRGEAMLVLDAADVAEALRRETAVHRGGPSPAELFSLGPAAAQVESLLLAHGPLTAASVAARLDLSGAEIAQAITLLEISKRLRRDGPRLIGLPG
ncbi:MAG: DNA-processing protein DprA [Phycisphaeraceae bacterium]|nr:DNA-processing protein DprA [Phycisphaeraceae bacterium]